MYHDEVVALLCGKLPNNNVIHIDDYGIGIKAFLIYMYHLNRRLGHDHNSAQHAFRAVATIVKYAHVIEGLHKSAGRFHKWTAEEAIGYDLTAVIYLTNVLRSFRVIPYEPDAVFRVYIEYIWHAFRVGNCDLVVFLCGRGY